MARGKNAAALFEVIHAAKQKEQLRAKGGGFLTPSWWFRGKAARQTSQSSQTSPNAERAQASIPAAKREPESDPAPAPLRIVQDEPEPVDQPERETVESHSEEPVENQTSPTTSEVFEESAERESQEDLGHNEQPTMHDPVITEKPGVLPSRQWQRPVDVGVDRQRRVINFRISYSSALISSFGLLILVALAFIIGKSAGSGPKLATAATAIGDVKNGKVSPEVMRVPPANKTPDDTPVSAGNTPKPPTQAPANKSGGTPPPAPAPAPAPQPKPEQTAQTPQTGTAANGKRIVGMQYILIQSYPDPEDAKEAAEALNKSGISVTIEKNFYYAPAWSCVITTRGFDRTKSNPEYDSFLKAIRDVSTQYSAANRYHPRFSPTPLAWK